MCPHQESNLDLRFRKPPFYPLNYEGFLCLQALLYNKLLMIEKGVGSIGEEERKKLEENLEELSVKDDSSYSQATLAGKAWFGWGENKEKPEEKDQEQ